MLISTISDFKNAGMRQLPFVNYFACSIYKSMDPVLMCNFERNWNSQSILSNYIKLIFLLKLKKKKTLSAVKNFNLWENKSGAYVKIIFTFKQQLFPFRKLWLLRKIIQRRKRTPYRDRLLGLKFNLDLKCNLHIRSVAKDTGINGWFTVPLL